LNYRSIGDVSRAVNANLYRIPDSVDVIVGIPRSGLIPASAIALSRNIPIVTLEAFLANERIAHGGTRELKDPSVEFPADAKHVLLVDDSARTGGTMLKSVRLVSEKGFAGDLTTCVAFATRKGAESVDMYLEKVPSPRAFEWNLFHKRKAIGQCCIDIDGVLCIDPSRLDNDDGERYLRFLDEAKPLVRPTAKLGVLVTSRLEKYRPQTERWLAKHGIEYDELRMLDAANAEERRRGGLAVKFKAAVYSEHPGFHIFIESSPRQSAKIASITGRSVLCFSEQRVYEPGMTFRAANSGAKKLVARGYRKFRQVIQSGSR
jgi:uncharacterized HAD superfamily protein